MKNARKLLISSLLVMPAVLFAGDFPRWWIDRGVIHDNTNAIPNDFALANQGQLKWIAIQCAKEFESRLPGGAGAEIWEQVGKLSSDGYDNTVFNQGQLKTLVKPFYERLEPDYVAVYPENLAGTDPWIFSDGLRNDYSAVNIGQLKRVFSFDFDRTELIPGDVISVSGHVAYSGSQQGDILIIASPNQAGFGTAYFDRLSSPGSFLITGAPANQQLWVRAFLDADGNGIGNGSEPWGSVVNPVSSSNNIIGVNIVLGDVGDDGDSLPDWWELNQFGTLAQNDTSNSDADGLSDLQEYLAGSDPTRADTDGDGLADDVDPSPLTADADGNGLSDGAEAQLSSSTNSYGENGLLIHVPSRGWYHATEPNLHLISLGE